MDLELITTADGSSSIFVPELNEHYHSTFGAIAESQHIFIKAGFRSKATPSAEINILEVGFGTGLNAFLTFLETIPDQYKINYTSIEPNILGKAITDKLNYASILNPSETHLFNRMHEAPWNEVVSFNSYFSLEKLKGNLENIQLPEKRFDLIYFDAFGPAVQPELWTEEVFKKIFEATAEGGILVTYSAKGSVRRALKAAGFSTEKLPGPTGKREITRAIKK